MLRTQAASAPAPPPALLVLLLPADSNAQTTLLAPSHPSHPPPSPAHATAPNATPHYSNTQPGSAPPPPSLPSPLHAPRSPIVAEAARVPLRQGTRGLCAYSTGGRVQLRAAGGGTYPANWLCGLAGPGRGGRRRRGAWCPQAAWDVGRGLNWAPRRGRGGRWVCAVGEGGACPLSCCEV